MVIYSYETWQTEQVTSHIGHVEELGQHCYGVSKLYYLFMHAPIHS